MSLLSASEPLLLPSSRENNENPSTNETSPNNNHSYIKRLESIEPIQNQVPLGNRSKNEENSISRTNQAKR